MSAIFLGTPAAAVPSLSALVQVDDVEMVITQPDRPAGRSGTPVASPVKVAAAQFGFRVEQPGTVDELTKLLLQSEAEFGLVVAYGRILTEEMLATLPAGFLNVHFSLLPRWRGAAPVERAIAAGDETTGVTLMRIDTGLDTGPVIAERVTAIAPSETGGSLTARLAHLGARLVDDAVPDYLSGRRIPVPQIATGATHAARLTKQEARITPSTPADVAVRLVRAFSPRPGAWTETNAGAIRIHGAEEGGDTGIPVGTIGVEYGLVVCSLPGGSMVLGRVQPSGKPAMSALSWMNGRRGEPAVLDT